MDAIQLVTETHRREILRLVWDHELSAGELADRVERFCITGYRDADSSLKPEPRHQAACPRSDVFERVEDRDADPTASPGQGANVDDNGRWTEEDGSQVVERGLRRSNPGPICGEALHRRWE